jgi:hypothetical protein
LQSRGSIKIGIDLGAAILIADFACLRLAGDGDCRTLWLLSSLGVNTDLKLTHFDDNRRSKIDPPGAPFCHQADAVFLAV